MAKYLELPESWRLPLLVRQRAALWRKAGIVFIHIPKAAGTSINSALYGRFMGHARASDLHRWAPKDVRSLPSFAVTRNPWDRLVSAYRFARQGQGIGGNIQARMWRPDRYQIPEFATFERFVFDWLVRQDITQLDVIFQPQSRFVCDSSGRVLVDHIGRVENFSPTYDFIRAHVGADVTFGLSNRSGAATEFRSFYNRELVEAVSRIYPEDIQRFGYSF